MNRTGAEIRASENQAKFIQDRISEVEKHFGELCTNFGSYSRKISHMRDKGDELSKSLMNYAENESLNHTTKGGLKEFAENLSAVQDYREIQMKRMEAKVIDPLMLYGTSCKNAKERLKAAFAARDREIKQKRSLDKVRERDPSNRHQIAETELQKASVDASYSSKALEEEIDRFEKTKLGDIKHILVDFVKVELMFHAKALEMYTNCYQNLLTMSEEDDLQEFRTSLHPPSIQSRLTRQQQHTASHSSLNTTGGQSGVTASNEDTLTPNGQPRFRPNTSDTLQSTNASSYYTDQQDEIDDDDEDDDDDDEDSDDNDEYARHMNGRK